MLVSDAARAVIQAATALLLLSGHAQIWHFVSLYGLNATAQAFFMPAVTALVPQVTPRATCRRPTRCSGSRGASRSAWALRSAACS